MKVYSGDTLIACNNCGTVAAPRVSNLFERGWRSFGGHLHHCPVCAGWNLGVKGGLAFGADASMCPDYDETLLV